MKDRCHKACFGTSDAILPSPASLCTASLTTESQRNLGQKKSKEITCSNPAQNRDSDTKTGIKLNYPTIMLLTSEYCLPWEAIQVRKNFQLAVQPLLVQFERHCYEDPQIIFLNYETCTFILCFLLLKAASPQKEPSSQPTTAQLLSKVLMMNII